MGNMEVCRMTKFWKNKREGEGCIVNISCFYQLPITPTI